MDKAIQIGMSLGLHPEDSMDHYSYLSVVKTKLEAVQGRFADLAYIQKMIDVLEAA